MHIYISQEQVDAYLCGFLSRLQLIDDLDDDVPKLTLEDRQKLLSEIFWITVGGSGESILRGIVRVLIEKWASLPKIESLNAIVDRNNKWVKFQDEPKIAEKLDDFPNRNIVIVDDVVRTGLSMRLIHEKARRLNANTITSYALGFKYGSCYIPSYFSMSANDADHIYIRRKQIGAYQLTTGAFHVNGENVCKYEQHDYQNLMAQFEDPKVKKWHIITKNMCGPMPKNLQCYVCETEAGLDSFVEFEITPLSECRVYALCKFDPKIQTSGVFSLMRFVDIYARHNQCKIVEVAGDTTPKTNSLLKGNGYVDDGNGGLYKKLF